MLGIVKKGEYRALRMKYIKILDEKLEVLQDNINLSKQLISINKECAELYRRLAAKEYGKRDEPLHIEFDENDLNICPVCNTHVKTDDKYCHECGQAVFMCIHDI